MANQYTNKVILGNETLIDLTSDTVTASDVASGVTFHLPNGQPSVGTASGGEPGGIIIRDTTDSHGGTIRELIASDLYSISSFSLSSNGTFYAPSGILWDEVIADVPSGISPSGTKSISILQNGTTTEDVSAFAYAQIITNVPNSYSAADEGKVVSGATLVGQTASTVTSNSIYDTTLINSLTVSVSGGGGFNIDEFAMRTISGVIEGNASFIESYAFWSCSYITGASFSLCESIGSYAFQGCFSLSSISFPLCRTIGSSAFNQCWYLTTAVFPSCVYVNSSAFNACASLTTISFPLCSLMYSYAFANCPLITEANFPSCSYMSGSAFMNDTALTRANFPSLTNVGGTAHFSNCKSLSDISFPLLSYVAPWMFSGCILLSSAYFPSAKTIVSYAFAGCSGLLYAEFPQAYLFSSSAFNNCYSLSTVIFGYSASLAQSIYATAFARCYRLMSIYILNSSVVQLQNTNAFLSTPISTYTTQTGGVNGSVFVPESLYSGYSSATNWATYYNAGRIVSLTDAQIANVIANKTHVM